MRDLTIASTHGLASRDAAISAGMGERLTCEARRDFSGMAGVEGDASRSRLGLDLGDENRRLASRLAPRLVSRFSTTLVSSHLFAGGRELAEQGCELAICARVC